MIYLWFKNHPSDSVGRERMKRRKMKFLTSDPNSPTSLYFINLLQAWCVKHKDEFISDSFDSKEGIDFILNISFNQNSDLQATVKCTCGRPITLTTKNGKLQLSNYQKHLRTTSCSHVKAIKRLNEEHRKDNSQQSSNSLSSSTSMASQSHIPS